ncbi:MAG: hypothetical protein K2X34_05740, partial [Hyphomonadaceae bacterium]|nr:hypothetical protein [Hyphomonadaceae bacterium]MBY0423819.1 hypothetical protein [Parvularculaceae bacterium]
TRIGLPAEQASMYHSNRLRSRGLVTLPASAAEDGTGKGKHTIVATATTGGVPPVFIGLWGAIDVIRDPYSDAASGGLRLTGLATMDVTISRAAQIEILTNVQDRP